MGTSSIYGGQKDKSSLLPTDYDELVNEEEKEEKPWQNVKSLMSKYINNNNRNKSGIIKKYIKASGGANNLVKNSNAGVRSTVNLGNFLASIKQNGLYDTLREFNIKYEGRNIEDVLSDIVNIISKDSISKEDSVAKNATVQALENIYEFIEDNNMELQALENMSNDMFDTVLCNYISAYIWEKMLNDLESRFEKYSSSPVEALEIENEFKQYIKNKVDIAYNKLSIKYEQFSNKNAISLVESIYKDCYNVLGEGL